jgi:hypothetical protein
VWGSVLPPAVVVVDDAAGVVGSVVVGGSGVVAAGAGVAAGALVVGAGVGAGALVVGAGVGAGVLVVAGALVVCWLVVVLEPNGSEYWLPLAEPPPLPEASVAVGMASMIAPTITRTVVRCRAPRIDSSMSGWHERPR